jgi:imidazolonepropionase-like amidohydrolase
MLEADGAKAIADADAFAVPTLVIIDAIRQAGASLGLSQDKLDKMQEVGRKAVGSLDLLRQAGAKIGFGTDLMGRLTNQQSREFRLRAEVCTPLEILRQATSINADLLQRAGELGVIAPGALADLLVVDGDPLSDISVLEDHARLALILKEGEVVRNTLS